MSPVGPLASAGAADYSDRRGDLSAARSAWQTLAQAYPDDPLSAVFLARLQPWQRSGVPADWDSVTRLGK